MPEVDAALLGLHILAGTSGLVLGPVALRNERRPPYRSPAGLAYLWSALGAATTALGLVFSGPAGIWWLGPLALLTISLALLGRLAPSWATPGWERAYAHGQGGSYIALVTAALVVSLNGPAQAIAWILPTATGVPLIELRVRKLRSEGPRTRQPEGSF